MNDKPIPERIDYLEVQVMRTRTSASRARQASVANAQRAAKASQRLWYFDHFPIDTDIGFFARDHVRRVLMDDLRDRVERSHRQEAEAEEYDAVVADLKIEIGVLQEELDASEEGSDE